jgi:prephenate dehydratase
LQPVGRRTFRGVFEAVQSGRAAWGLIPVENSQAGSILETYDLVLEFPLRVVGECFWRVDHCLLARPGAGLIDIRRVHSHPQALLQCQAYLRRHRWQPVVADDTAGAAAWVSRRGRRSDAAIASRHAAERYGLAVLAERIQTVPNNLTRFFVLKPPRTRSAPPWRVAPGSVRKTSIAFFTRHAPGALHQALGCFARRRLNLTKLESRPSRHRPWEYVFYVDFEDPGQGAREALTELRRVTQRVVVLGTYPAAPAP